MPMRETDWIVSPDGWLISDTPGWHELAANEGIVLALTWPAAYATSSTSRSIAKFENADEWVLERIRGQLHWYIKVPATPRSFAGIMDMRLEVLDADPATGTPLVPIPPSSFDLTDPVDANRSWLDHQSFITHQDATWTDPAVYTGPVTGSVTFDCKAKRKLWNSQVIALTCQWTDFAAAAMSDLPDIVFVTRFRTLGSQ